MQETFARRVDPPCDWCASGATNRCERTAFGHLEPGLQTGYCADTGGGNSINHGGGQNVLFVGGHVRWCTQPTVGVENDHIYLNQRRVIQAGVRRSDRAARCNAGPSSGAVQGSSPVRE